MDRNDFVCAIDLRVCGRGCETNPHNCPCIIKKETISHGHLIKYLGNGKAPLHIALRQERGPDSSKDKE